MTELGKRLKEAREAKNISLDELQDMTKIQKRYLIGIEEGNYAIMPGNFYVRAFIRQYAEAVGLDPEQIFEEYKQDIPQSYQDEIPQPLSRVKTRQQLSPESTKWLNLLPKLLIAAVVVGIAVIIWLLLQNNAGNKPESQVKKETTTEVESSENSPLEKAKEKAGKQASHNKREKASQQTKKATAPKATLNVVETRGNLSTIELTNTDQFVIELTSKGNSWVEVYNTKGHSFFKGSLTNGQTQTFDLSAETEVFVKIGRTLDVDMKVNGKPFTYPIDPKDEVFQKMKFIFKKS
ncbi:helix-turn-helix domain-containing protein [Parageobacillus sp. VR-IP]|uniref:RodZ domain-containing protein n=1 Tax=Parageobacillus sp. VR-IP TaxID=2742205 RepID=UPI00158175CE|nr:RodZ domain-containing protein [Parageobacillus sp. VR-IP]NUK29186.1 helix-turn-helix domain-containing protein [Parageobacillus sp. VR-IP]